METNDKSEVVKNIPLVPLRDLVVFPSTLVPFIIGRESSIQALEKLEGYRSLDYLIKNTRVKTKK